MSGHNEYLAGWVDITIHEFLGEIGRPSPVMAYTLVTHLDSNPDVFSVTERFPELGKLRALDRPIGSAALLDTRELLAAIRQKRIFFGFDEVWFFPGKDITPIPDDFSIVRPGPIDIRRSSNHLAWLTSNRCYLGLGDGEGMNYCLKVRGVAKSIVEAFNEAVASTAEIA